MFKTHIVRLKTSLYKQKEEALSCAVTKERQSLGFYCLVLDRFFSLDTKLTARFLEFVEGSPSFGHRNQENPDLVVLVGSDRSQYVR